MQDNNINLYTCKYCNYHTKDRSNLFKHKTTKKHKKNVSEKSNIKNSTCSNIPVNSQWTKKTTENNESYSCNYCGKSIARYNNVNKHIKSCIAKQKVLEDNKILLERLKEKDKLLEQAKADIETYKTLLFEAGSMVKTSLSTMSHVIKNYDNAPGITHIQPNTIKFEKEDDIELANQLLSKYRHKTLIKYFGNIILDIYKKHPPCNQSVWATDASRLTYIIKEFINGKEKSNWIFDKMGNKTKEYLIDPLMEYIGEIITKRKKHHLDIFLNLKGVEQQMEMENIVILNKLSDEIKDGIMANNILKYITPKLTIILKNNKQNLINYDSD